MRKLESKPPEFLTARPWEEGMVVAGFFVDAETINGADSRKLVFDVDGKAHLVACWETGILKGYVPQLTKGQYVVMKCLGKSADTKRGKAWDFEVYVVEEKPELLDCIAKYAPSLLKS